MRKVYARLAFLSFAGTLALLSFLPSQVGAQCNVTVLQPLNNVVIQMTSNTVTLDQIALATYLGPANGPAPCDACVIWIEDPNAPPGTWVSSLTLSCDLSTLYSSGPYRIRASSSPYDPACASTVVDINVNLNDVTDPTINTTSGSTPNCGSAFNLNTQSNYNVDGNAAVNAGAGGYDCQSTLNWVHPLFTDNCTLGANSSLTISYTAGTPAPSALPTNETLNGAAAIAAASGTSTSASFYGGAVCTGQTIVRYTLTDETGNVSTCQFTVNVSDNQVPTWTNPIGTGQWPAFNAIVSQTWNTPPLNRLGIVLNCDSSDYQQAFDYFTNTFTPIASDNCDANPTESFLNSVALPTTCGIPYSQEFRWNAVDTCGNSTAPLTMAFRFKLNLVVLDSTSPDFSDATPGVVVPKAPVTETGIAVARIFTADTLVLNVSDYDPTVCEVDLTGDPLLAVTAVDCQNVVYDWQIVSSFDLLGNPTGLTGLTGGPDDNNADLVYPVGVHQIRYRATENCAPGIAKASTYTFWLEVVDDVPPVITDCPANVDTVTVTDLCENTIVWSLPTATDNCPAGGITRIDQAFDYAGGVITVVLGVGNTAFATFPNGTSQVLHIYEDLYGNRDTCTFTVTVNDTQAPSIVCGGDQTIYSICPTAPLPNFTSNWASIDENCPGYSVSQSPLAGTTLAAILAPNVPANNDVFTVTLTVTDIGGNTGDCTFQVTILDQDLPVPDVMPLPAINPMTTLGTDCGSYILCSPSATKCNGQVVYGTTSIAGAIFDPNLCGPGQPGYTILNPSFNALTWTYDDGLGNVITQTQQVDIFADVTAPTLNCPADVMVNTDPGVCTTTGIMGLTMTETFPTLAPYLQPVDAPSPGEMIDNCGIISIGWASTSGSAANTNNAGTGIYNLGDNIVTFTAADQAGNSSSCTFTVTVVDNQAPTFTCPVGTVFLYTGDAGDMDLSDCAYTLSGLNTSLDPANVIDNCTGQLTISYVVNPFFMSGNFTDGPSSSSLAGSTFSVNPNTGNDQYGVTWTIQDPAGNAASCNFTIVVIDLQPPVIACPSSPQARTTSQDGMPGDCYYTASGTEFDLLSATDNCLVVSTTNNFNGSTTLDGESFPQGNTVVTWTVGDANGNLSVCDVTISVTDDEAPVNMYCPSNVVLPNVTGDCENDVAWVRPNENSWTDNCDASNLLTVTESISDASVQAAINNNSPYNQTAFSVPQTSFPVGVTTITYVATDLSNNSSSCSFTVTILDTEAPSAICPPNQMIQTVCAQGAVPDYRGLITATDNCPANLVVSQSPAPGTLLVNIPGITPADGEVFTVTITVTDGLPNGLSGQCSFQVELDEVNLPVPALAILPNLYTDCGELIVTAPSANDCGNTLYGIPNQGTLVDLNLPPRYRYTTGIYNIVWTFIGANGNVFQSQQIVVDDDTTPPNALCKPLNVNLSSSNPGTVTLAALDFDNGSTDNCTIVGYDFSVNGGPYLPVQTFGCAEVGNHTISLQVTDAYGNQGYCNTTLTINDVTNPTIVGGCPSNITAFTSSNGQYDCDASVTFTVPGVTDNCAISNYFAFLNLPGGGTITYDVLGVSSQSTTLPKGLTMATLLVIDEYGNSSFCSFQINVLDDQLPTITCPASQTRVNDPGVCGYTTGGNEFDPLSVADNCPGVFSYNNVSGYSSLDGVYFPVGSHTVIWTAEDAAGLTASCAFTIAVQDTEAPIIFFCQTNIQQLATSGTCNALVSWSPTFGFDVADNCGIANITQQISNPSVVPVYPFLPYGPDFPPFLLNNALFPVGTTTVSYTVTDIHGNQSVCSFQVDIIDDQAPIIICPPAQTLNTVCASGTVPDYSGLIGTLTDNCYSTLILTQSPAAGTPLANVPGLTPANGETFTVSFTAQDANPLFLSASCNFQVTLNDVNLPVPNQSSLPFVYTDCEQIILSPPTANDCGNTMNGIPDKGVQISFNPPLYRFDIGFYTVIWTYVGANGSVQQVQQIQVDEDTTPPSLTCANTTVVLNSSGSGSITPQQVTGNLSDNCGIDVVTVTPSVFGCAQVGNNTVLLSATDIHGNTSSCNATVTVQDLTPPTFNFTTTTITAACDNVPAAPNVVASDACGIAQSPFTQTSSKGGNPNNCNFYNYTIVRTWTASDVNNNTSTVTQTVIVQDVVAPTWTNAMPDTIHASSNPFSCDGQVILTVEPAKVFDNCAAFANLTITYTGAPQGVGNGTTNASGTYPVGYTTVTFTAVDPCGNASVHKVVVKVADTTPPTPVCINSITLPLNAQGQLSIPPQVVDNGSYDNCPTSFSTSDVMLSVFPNFFTCQDAGKTIIVTLTVTDLAGNQATCPAAVTVIDNTVPMIMSCAPDVTVSCEADTSPQSLGEPVVFDACGATITHNDVIVPVGGAICRRIDRTWRVTDSNGNTQTCLQRISIFDNVAPSFTTNLPANLTIDCGTPVPPPANMLASDNCGVPLISFSVSSTQTNSGICSDHAYQITRTWTATDACQNAVQHTQIITIIDTIAPVISGLPQSVTLFTNDFNADLCSAPLTLQAQAADCQPAAALTWSNNSPFGPGNSSASGNYQVGTYPVTFIVTDRCGNDAAAFVQVNVIDNSTPTAVCFTNVNVTLNSQGEATIFISQIDNQSYDNCTAHGDLLLSLSQTFFNCSNLGVNFVTLTVQDQAGNANSCISEVVVNAGSNNEINHSGLVTNESFPNAGDGAIDMTVSGGSGQFSYSWTGDGGFTANTLDISGLNSGTYTLVVTDLVTDCIKTIVVFVGIDGIGTITISGLVLSPTGLPVAEVEMEMAGSVSGTFVTGVDGYYEFAIPQGSTVTITPSKEINPANGVTSLDFAVIQQHILAPPNMKPLTTPLKLIAADENANASINGIDIAQFQSTILNNQPSFQNAPSWVFVDADFTFPNPQLPWQGGWPTSLTYTNIGVDVTDAHFIGVKMGDVTDDVNVTQLQGGDGAEVRSAQDLELLIADVVLEAGTVLQVPVTAGQFEMLRAYQFTWQFDVEALKLAAVEAGDLPNLGKANFRLDHPVEGRIPHLWFHGQAQTAAQGTPLYTLTFEVLRSGDRLSDVLGLVDDYLGRIAYDEQGNARGIYIRFQESNNTPVEGDDLRFALIGNSPNPFSHLTQIEYVLPQALPVSITVTDLSGKAVARIEADGGRGRNVLVLRQDQLPGVGMYIYVLKAGEYQATGKLYHQD
jgi:hypothetical protein